MQLFFVMHLSPSAAFAEPLRALSRLAARGCTSRLEARTRRAPAHFAPMPRARARAGLRLRVVLFALLACLPRVRARWFVHACLRVCVCAACSPCVRVCARFRQAPTP